MHVTVPFYEVETRICLIEEIQGLTHGPDIFGHLAHLSDIVGLKKVIAPWLSWSHIVNGY